MEKKTVLLVGATGLVGGYVLKSLLEHKTCSREAFRRVDASYPLMVARAALNGGCRHFLLVSDAIAEWGAD